MTNNEQPGRKGKFIQVFSGGRFWPLDPKPEEIVITDIAHSLANQCRFSGHTEKFYSVAQHSVLVSWFCKDQMAGLMHDASEAYLVDVPRPIKPEFPQYMEIESNIMRVIAEKFGFSFPLDDDIKLADTQLLWVEKRDLLKPGLDWFQDSPLELTEAQKNMHIHPWPPEVAEREFLYTYKNLIENPPA